MALVIVWVIETAAAVSAVARMIVLVVAKAITVVLVAAIGLVVDAVAVAVMEE